MTARGICSVEGCGQPNARRDWCNAHYLRWRRHGDPLGGGPAKHPLPPGDGKRTCSVDDCQRPYYGRGLCNTHLARLTRHGDVNKRTKRPTGGLRAEVEAAAADRSDGPCLLLTGQRERPTVRLHGVGMTASRATWMIANGDPGDLHVLHTCGAGREGCVRLAHLYLGSNADNGRDAARDGSMARGERHYLAHLTEEDVHAIRRLLASGLSRGALADQFGVKYTTVRDIDKGITWAWLVTPGVAA